MRKQVLRLLDTLASVEALNCSFHFRAGLQMGLELGAIDLLQNG